MNIAAGAVKGYYEIGLTYINHRVKVRVFNKETFSDLVDRLLCILSIDKEDRFIALKQENSEKLIYNNDELVPEDFYQLVFVDNGINKPKELIAEEEKIEKSKSEPFKSEEPGNARAKK